MSIELSKAKVELLYRISVRIFRANGKTYKALHAHSPQGNGTAQVTSTTQKRAKRALKLGVFTKQQHEQSSPVQYRKIDTGK